MRALEATRQSWDPESLFAEGFLRAVSVAGWRSLADRLGPEACVLSCWAWALGPARVGRDGRGALPCQPWAAGNAEPAPATSSRHGARSAWPRHRRGPSTLGGGWSQEASGSAAGPAKREGSGAGRGCRPRVHSSMRLCPPG